MEGVVELLANGSGFVRVDPPDPSDEDIYISSAQVKRCELVSGDRIAGPKRAPRRSERFASLIRVETINGRPASELADSVRFDDLPAAMPSERLKVGSEDPTLKAIEWLTPFGKGSRVTIVGASRSGKSEALRRLAAALAGREEFTLSVALAGVRPEEISEWAQGPVAPAAAVSFAASEEAQNGAIEPVIDQARRLAARGADAIVLIDTLDGASRQTARKALASARNIVDGGSVTVIATASQPIGGETTVISLDVALSSMGRFPALDLLTSGTLRPELLVGEAGAGGDRPHPGRGLRARRRRVVAGLRASVGRAAAAMPRHGLVTRLLPAVPQVFVDLGRGDRGGRGPRGDDQLHGVQGAGSDLHLLGRAGLDQLLAVDACSEGGVEVQHAVEAQDVGHQVVQGHCRRGGRGQRGLRKGWLPS